MVIQRIQSLYLLLAAISMTLFIFMAPVSVDAEGAAVATVCSNVPLLAASIASIALLLVDIFLFANLKRQIMVTGLTAALVSLVIVFDVVVIFNDGTLVMRQIIYNVLMPVVALICTMMARRCMQADEKLLRDANRLR